jgi:prepilin-type N-terminal cleavage/methylation domain-containing protein
MLKRMRNKKGFTLIEIMIVVAIVGILAAIAIPAYLEHTVKAKITEVTTAMDAIAQAATEYHAAREAFPTANYNYNALAAVSTAYCSWNYETGQPLGNANIRAQFNTALNPVNGYNLIMLITYAPGTGYSKIYMGNLPLKYMPKK